MTMFVKAFAAASVAVLAISPMAQAQDYGMDPTYADFSLETGFEDDPQTVELTAGGTERFDDEAGCAGYVAEAPDVRITYTAGEFFPLSFFVSTPEDGNAADTILLINTPGGEWVCNDDYDPEIAGVNPGIIFEAPESGQYDIWVGSYQEDLYPDAVLYITELAPFAE
jgi:hypothetical protein